MTAEEELALIDRVLAGEKEAFAPLVQTYQDYVYTLARRTVNHEADAADLAQEAFLRAFRHLAEFRGESRFSTWLYRLTVNLCRDFLRRKKRTDELSLEVGEEDGTLILPDLHPLPEEEIQRREVQRQVREALAGLPEEYRLLLTLREMNGLSYREIGQITGLEEGTIKSRLHRARKRLADSLCQSGNFSAGAASNRRKGGDGR